MGTTIPQISPSSPRLTLRRETVPMHDTPAPVTAWIVRHDGNVVGVFGTWGHAMQLINAHTRKENSYA